MPNTELFKKYDMLTDGLLRTYVIDTSDRRLDMDSVTPRELILLVPRNWGTIPSEPVTSNPKVKRFEISAWSNLLADLVEYLQKNSPKSEEELLNFELDWSSAKPFRETKDIVNMVQLKNGLYFSVNHSAAHSQWMVGELLHFYGLDFGKLIVHRPPFSEPKEVTDFIKEERTKGFKSFLISKKGLTEERAVKVFNAINGPFNKVLNKLASTAFNDFFLFDDCTLLSTMKSKFIASLPYLTGWDEKQISTAKRYMDYLTDYFTSLFKEAKNHKDDLIYPIYIL